MKQQTKYPIAGIGNMGQLLYSVPRKAPPMNPFEWIVIGVYGFMLFFTASVIFGTGYWLGHLNAAK